MLEVSEADAGMRLDAFLSKAVPSLSRARASWHLRGGHVSLSDPGGKLKPSHRVRAGFSVSITVQARPEPSSAPEDLPLDIRFEDDDLLIVHKPAGMVVHPAPGHPSGTLINALLHHVPILQQMGGDEIRPGLVHRIDKDTSGLLVVSKNAEVMVALQKRFATHDIERSYLAVCLGRLREDRLTIETLHGRHPRDRKRYSGRVEQGRRAVTHVEVIARSALCSLVRCTLETGRTHQIRMHLAERGHPIAGDKLYGGVRNHSKTPLTRPEIAALRRLNRQALHAAALGFVHPVSGETMSFDDPLPGDLRQLVERLFGSDVTI
ncbi:MAG: RluA family pseudouridine synthase [Myxococcales bacterium]|nr:RluA family pseudouridine synthase [Myxococcales bacterium]